MENNDRFYVEYVILESDDEKEEAETYLKLWLKFFPRRIVERGGSIEILEVIHIDQPGYDLGNEEIIKRRIGLKIKVRINERLEKDKQ